MRTTRPPPLLLLLLTAALFSTARPLEAKGGKPGAAKPGRERNEPYSKAFRDRVTKAVDGGVEYLLKKQATDGSWNPTKPLLDHRLGHTALSTLACLKGGLTIRDPQILKALAWMRPQKLKHTYDVGILLMALHALYAPTDERTLVEVDKYGRRKIKDPCKSNMTKKDRAWMQKGVDFLLKHQVGGHWRYPEGGMDVSNTQYALLGLWAASRCGFKIPSKAWLDSLNWLLKSQESSGRKVNLLVNELRGDYRVVWTEKARARGFRYIPGKPAEGRQPVTGSMTTAGMAALAICQDELWAARSFSSALRLSSRRAIRDAMAWIQDNFDVQRNPGQPSGGWHYYYLYGLERAGVLSRARFMGRYDWYKEGADYLLEKQRSDGSWLRESDPQLDTAFAVLFLKRSTARTRNPVISNTQK